jgi:hypothetical protein
MEKRKRTKYNKRKGKSRTTIMKKRRTFIPDVLDLKKKLKKWVSVI